MLDLFGLQFSSMERIETFAVHNVAVESTQQISSLQTIIQFLCINYLVYNEISHKSKDSPKLCKGMKIISGL